LVVLHSLPLNSLTFAKDVENKLLHDRFSSQKKFFSKKIAPIFGWLTVLIIFAV